MWIYEYALPNRPYADSSMKPSTLEHASKLAREFREECEEQGMNVHVRLKQA